MDTTLQIREKDLERIRRFRLIDDAFFTKCFEEDTECTALILRILLDNPTLKVTQAHTQYTIGNMKLRSLRLDVLATDDKGSRYNVEIQRADSGASRKRARFHSAMLDAALTPAGEKFDDLCETYVIFITEHDVFSRGLPLYTINRVFDDNGERFDDGTHILYVNGAYRGDSLVGMLMHDFFCTDPDDMHFPTLAGRVRFFKESEEGVTKMCQILEEVKTEALAEGRAEGLAEGRVEGRVEGRAEGRVEGRAEGHVDMVRRMLKHSPLSLDEIVVISGMTLDEVLRIQSADED